MSNLGKESLDQDYEFIRELVYKLSRISLGPQKKQMVLSRITKRMRALQHDTVRQYCDFLKSASGRNELSSLIDVISTNHTYFFRETSHFDFLTREILLPLRGKGGGTFRVWSAACSSGEEPYSVAMILAEQAKVDRGFQWKMEATDISSIVLKKAEEGVYPETSLSRTPEVLRSKYFSPTGQNQDQRIIESIRKKIHYTRLNLFEIPQNFPSPFELIICRNVMIYFDRPTREELVRSLTERLVPGGYLFVGHSESLGGIKHTLKMVKPAIYRKA